MTVLAALLLLAAAAAWWGARRTGSAGDYQVEGARTFAMLNIGGSGTTIVSLVIG